MSWKRVGQPGSIRGRNRKRAEKFKRRTISIWRKQPRPLEMTLKSRHSLDRKKIILDNSHWRKDTKFDISIIEIRVILLACLSIPWASPQFLSTALSFIFHAYFWQPLRSSHSSYQCFPVFHLSIIYYPYFPLNLQWAHFKHPACVHAFRRGS